MALSKKLETRIQQINALMDPIIADTSVPRNIRKAVADAKERISKSGDLDVSISSAIYLLDEAANDINLPFHARTDVWNLVSELEKLKEEIKAA
jgi:uncharacterized protein (UPF0147 family)